MNTIAMNAVQNVLDGSSAASTQSPPADAGAFAQLLGSFTPPPAAPASGASGAGPLNTATDAAQNLSDTAASESAELAAPPLPDTTVAPAAPDASLIAAMLGQLQAPYTFAPAIRVEASTDNGDKPGASPMPAPGITPVADAANPALALTTAQAATTAAQYALQQQGAAAATQQTQDDEKAALTPDTASSTNTQNPSGSDADPAVRAAAAEASKAFTVPTAAIVPPTLADAALTQALRQTRMAPDTATAADSATNRATATDESRTSAQPSLNPAADGAAKAARTGLPAQFETALENAATAYDGEPKAIVVPAAPAGQTRPTAFREAFDRTPDISAAALSVPATVVHRQESLPQVGIAPRLESPEWQPAFASSVKMLVNDGTSAASLQLNPAEFGPIDVRIVVTDQRADISFMVSNADANAAIQSAMTELRDQLARSGIQLGQTSVGAHSQDPRQPQTPQSPSPQPRQAANNPGTVPAAGAPLTPRPRANGQIDTFA